MSGTSKGRGARLAVMVLLGATLVATGPAGPGASAGSDPRPFEGDPSWVAYQTFRDGQEGVWLVHPDGTGDHQVDFGLPVTVLLPDWSPDGRRLAVTSRGGPAEPLYEHDLDTGTTRQLFDCEYPCLGDDEPAYHPDGRSVAFIRYLGPFSEESGPADCSLWVGDLESGEVRRLTDNDGCDREYGPRWSPNGRRLTYHRDLPGPDGSVRSAVYVIDADGTGERQLTRPRLVGGNPDWSPDGEWIVFSSHAPIVAGWSPDADLWRVRPDGTGLERLTHYRGVLGASQPSYTPDGEWVVFTADRPDRKMLWAIPAEGGQDVVLADDGQIHTHGRWQPGGEQ